MVTIYHNPRCSKSREALKLLGERGVEPQVRLYLEQPPSFEELSALLDRLGIEPLALMRRGEREFKELGLAVGEHSRDELIQAMVDHPILIERPIVINGDQAVLARPPERAADVL